MTRLAALLALCSLGLAACGSSGGSGGAGGTGGPLGLALSLTPKTTGPVTSFEFSDTQAIRKVTGTQLTRQGSFYGEGTYSLWKLPDVQWEAQTVTDSHGPPLKVTGLSPSFDFGPAAKKLGGCGYHKSSAGDAIVYTAASQSTVLHCLDAFGQGVPIERSIAYSPSKHVVVRSASPDQVISALSQEGDLRHDATVSALVSHLSGADAVAIAPGPAYCKTLTDGFMGRAASAEEISSALQDYPAGMPYTGFALGLDFAAGGPSGRIVLHYADGDSAGRDAKMREHLLRTEKSVQTQKPYSDLLHLDKASTEGADATFEVSPGRGKPLPLYDMWLRFDLAFARC